MLQNRTVTCRKRYDQNQIVSGLLEFVIETEGYVPENTNSCLKSVVNATFGNSENREFTIEIPIYDQFNHQLIFDTYAFPDGPLQVEITIDGNSFKFSCTVSNGNSDQAKQLRQLPVRFQKGVVFEGSCDSQLFNFSLGDVSQNESTPNAIEKTIDQIRFEEHGFHIERNLIDSEMINSAKKEFSRIEEYELYGHVKGSSARLVNVHKQSEALRQVYESKKISTIVANLLGEESYAAQSLGFVYGSQQSAHSDWIHLSTFPHNSMCGVWIALEDVAEGSGELFYFPGSHKYPRISMDFLQLNKISSVDPNWEEFGYRYNREIARVLSENFSEPTKFLPKAGDVLFWHENLIHGDGPRMDMSLTRYSMVLHFYKKSCYAWYDSTGISGNKDMDL